MMDGNAYADHGSRLGRAVIESRRFDLDAIRQANPLASIVGADVKLRRAGNEYKGCCPFHADRTPSFTIFAGGERFQCFGCGAQGDVLDYVQRAHNVTLPQAAEMLGGGQVPSIHVPPVSRDEKPDRLEEASAIWANAVPATGTPAETYLRWRGLHLPLPDSIRFASLPYGKRGPALPCLVAAVVAADGILTGIQRTYLAADGRGKAEFSKPKLSLGRVAGGAIRLGPPAVELLTCEGLEDGLTLQQELERVTWVSAGSSMLPSMQFPNVVRSIAIGGDNDDAGRAAAQKAAQAFAERGLSARMFFPIGFKDFNAALQGIAA
jgi:DNA primase